MTFISQDDHLTAGAWAACAVNRKNQSPYNYNIYKVNCQTKFSRQVVTLIL